MKEKRFLPGFLGFVVVLSLAAMLFFPFGCSKMLPTSPGEDQVKGYSAEDLWPAPPASLIPWPRTCSAEISGICSPDGGARFELEAECFSLVFEVESGALDEGVVLTAGATLFNYFRYGELEKGLRFNFGPDGVIFHKDAKVEFEVEVLGAKDGEVLKLYWYNSHTGLWEVEQEEEIKGEMLNVSFYVSHFSRYAISE